MSGKALIEQNQQVRQQQLEPNQQAAAQKRIGYDYPAPSHDLVNPFQDRDDLHSRGDHHEVIHHDDHHEHHDPGYWKKKLIWKPGWKKTWKKAKKEIWKTSFKLIWKPIWVPIKTREWKDIWLPDVKKIWRPVWISEWFPSPDHHEHHESHGWDRSDTKSAESQKLVAVAQAPRQSSPQQQTPQQYSPAQTKQSTMRFPK